MRRVGEFQCQIVSMSSSSAPAPQGACWRTGCRRAPQLRVLLLEAGRDAPPGAEPDDVLDTYPRSYYNDAYFWPELKVHWRRKDNSPLVGFSQGRVIGGGSA